MQYYNPYQYQAYNQQANQGLLWVQGESGAKNYIVTPNTTVLLMDSEAPRFYLKSTDNTGMPSLRVFEYQEIKGTAPKKEELNLDKKYVTREEYQVLEQHYKEMADKITALSSRGTRAKKEQAVKEDTANE